MLSPFKNSLRNKSELTGIKALRLKQKEPGLSSIIPGFSDSHFSNQQPHFHTMNACIGEVGGGLRSLTVLIRSKVQHDTLKT